MDKINMKFKFSLLVIFSILSLTTAKVITADTKLPLLVKNIEPAANLTTSEIINSSNLLTKLTSNEIDPNVHPIENSSPPLEDAETPLTNEVLVETPAEELANPEVSPDVNPETDTVNVDDPNPVNKFCKCTELACDCCRTFGLPIIPIRGPACARIRYLGDEKMSVQLKYGDVVLATRTISGKKATPICVPMPGGYTQFCGRVYGLSKGKDDFKACLGFEIRAEDEVEAALRISCFKFGAQGFAVSEAEPFPAEAEKDEEDDDDDFFGFGGGDDDDDDDEGSDSGNDDDDLDFFGGDSADDDDDADYPTGQDSPDYDGFSLLGSLFSSGSKKLKNTSSKSKTTNDNLKSANATIADSPHTKEIPLEESAPTNSDSDADYDSKEDDDEDDDDDDDDEDDDEDESVAPDADKTDKIVKNKKVKKQKMSTMEYIMDFISTVFKIF